MSDYLTHAGGNPGRSGHRLSIAAGRVIYNTREAVAELLGVTDPLRIVFTNNATEAINLVLHGLLQPGDRVVTTGVEHNAVMRPLVALRRRGVDVVVAPGTPEGVVQPQELAAAITPGTRLVVAAHASNVSGAVLQLSEVVAAAHKVGAELLVDAAQTVGSVPLAVDAMGIDYLAFSGHKGLLGPPGTGGLAVGPHVNAATLSPLVYGGTGSRSESLEQPLFLPDRFESGTPNGVGLAGLGAGVRYVMERGVEAILAHEQELRGILCSGLAGISGVTIYGPPSNVATGVLSFTVKGKRVSEIAQRLDEDHGVLCRVGLHCAPAAHSTIGTFPEGTIRFAAGPYVTADEVEQAVVAVQKVVAR